MAESLANLKLYLGITDDSEDELLSLLIKQADAAIIKKRYPFGATDEQKANALLEYSDIELNIAVYLYNKMGAEGQTSHNENGVNRSYESAGIPTSFTRDITPFVGSIIR
jgi:hypothetical protein